MRNGLLVVKARRLVAVLFSFVFVLSLSGCGNPVRGAVSASPDGKTYFGVLNDNGGKCGPLKVDGVVWPHPIGEVVEFRPGRHTISCPADISFDVPSGVVFKFNYWGP